MTLERLSKYGYARGCYKCEAMRRGDRRRPHKSHTPTCKERIKQATIEDDVDKDQVEAVEQRIDEYLESTDAQQDEEDQDPLSS